MSTTETEAADVAPAVSLTRRELVTLGAIAAAGALGSAAALAGYLRPGGTSGAAGVAEIPAEQLALWEATPLLVAQRPAAVVRTPADVFAVDTRCTHLGCIVKWQKPRRIFFCPCHGARFGPDGSLLGGPAPTPLPSLRVTQAAGRIRVELA